MKFFLAPILVLVCCSLYGQSYELSTPTGNSKSYVNISQKGEVITNTETLGITTQDVINMVQNSEMEDKALIIMVLSQYEDPYSIWEEVIVLAETYRVFADELDHLITEKIKSKN